MTFKSTHECVQTERWVVKENVHFRLFSLKLLKKKTGLLQRLWTMASAQSDGNLWLVSAGPKGVMYHNLYGSNRFVLN